MNAAADSTGRSVAESTTTSRSVTAAVAEARTSLDPRGIVTTLIDSLRTPTDLSNITGDAEDNHPSKRAKTQDRVAYSGKTYSAPVADTGNPFHKAPSATRNLLLTLHILFPHALLPALDLLDRGEVLRVPRAELSSSLQPPPLLLVRSSRQSRNAPRQQRPHHPNQSSRRQGGSANAGHDSDDALDGDRQDMTASAAYDGAQYHEIRLDAWTCSCPAFAFAAFPAPPEVETNDSSDDRQEGEHDVDHSGPPLAQMPPLSPRRAEFPTKDGHWRFGGLSIGTDLPVCKHLLAAVLGERCAIFRPMVKERATAASLEEVAGWAAGWGG